MHWLRRTDLRARQNKQERDTPAPPRPAPRSWPLTGATVQGGSLLPPPFALGFPSLAAASWALRAGAGGSAGIPALPTRQAAWRKAGSRAAPLLLGLAWLFLRRPSHSPGSVLCSGCLSWPLIYLPNSLPSPAAAAARNAALAPDVTSFSRLPLRGQGGFVSNAHLGQ